MFGRWYNFAGQWLRLSISGGTRAVKVVKALTVIAFGIAAAAGLIGSQRDVLIPWQPTVGVVALVVVVAIWASVAFGMTWARFRALVIAGELEWHPDDRLYQLPITNTAATETEVPVFVVAVADANGETIPSKPRVGVELGWVVPDPKARPRLAHGMPYKVKVFKVGPPFPLGDGWVADLSFCDMADKGVVLGKVYSHNRQPLWIKLLIGSAATERWFSIQPSDERGRCKVASSAPPFIQTTPTWLARGRAAVNRFLHHPRTIMVGARIRDLLQKLEAKPKRKRK